MSEASLGLKLKKDNNFHKSLSPRFTLPSDPLELDDDVDDVLSVRLREESDELEEQTALDDLTFFLGGFFGVAKSVRWMKKYNINRY